MTPVNKGLVVSGHKEATKAGIDILNKGGNAIDAAIATSAVLAVSIPNMNGLGGDSIALWFDQKKKKSKKNYLHKIYCSNEMSYRAKTNISYFIFF